jgi:hypothetical protein
MAGNNMIMYKKLISVVEVDVALSEAVSALQSRLETPNTTVVLIEALASLAKSGEDIQTGVMRFLVSYMQVDGFDLDLVNNSVLGKLALICIQRDDELGKIARGLFADLESRFIVNGKIEKLFNSVTLEAGLAFIEMPRRIEMMQVLMLLLDNELVFDFERNVTDLLGLMCESLSVVEARGLVEKIIEHPRFKQEFVDDGASNVLKALAGKPGVHEDVQELATAVLSKIT